MDRSEFERLTAELEQMQASVFVDVVQAVRALMETLQLRHIGRTATPGRNG
jgi:hypothetical protein